MRVVKAGNEVSSFIRVAKTEKAIPMLAVAALILAIFAQTSGEQKTVTGILGD